MNHFLKFQYILLAKVKDFLLLKVSNYLVDFYFTCYFALSFSLNYEFYILVLYCTQIRLLGKKTRVNIFYDKFITIISDGIKILYNFIQKHSEYTRLEQKNILQYKSIGKTFKLYQISFIHRI